IVLQDTFLFDKSVRENIRYGRLNATDEEVEKAAKAAYADNFIRALPNGYDTILNDNGSNLSAGQKQMLAIARAFLADAKIVILDEASSSIDTRTELDLQKAFKALTKNRTSFMIAHRLSTIRDADMILVIKDGEIEERGKHDELMKKQGLYYQLYEAQFGGKEI
ncbi:MAG: ATP-binding cassette domain-containing protein, partial [Malacoplasma sp.]|nr:ATP-binding cassette domain-containing protein [Malacoplasma sp.]MCF0227565.1 ATP-binding cassette domain-containing protein [Malacoplasma sp.]